MRIFERRSQWPREDLNFINLLLENELSVALILTRALRIERVRTSRRVEQRRMIRNSWPSLVQMSILEMPR